MISSVEEYQKRIQDLLSLASENIIFDNHNFDNIFELSIFTINPNHKQKFLFVKSKAFSLLDSYKNAYSEIIDKVPFIQTYTIEWTNNDNHILTTSYFRANNIYELLDKFYCNRDINSFKIFKIYLNPIS